MRTVNEVSRITGISVRTLHHYDAIGLLKPARLTEAGYRLYDEASIARLQSILLLKELRFSLKEIGEILDGPDFNPAAALEDQIALLEMERERIGRLIALAREIQKKGDLSMSFNAFDRKEQNAYREEARARWGATKEYAEFEQKKRAGKNFDASGDAMMALFAQIGALRDREPADAEVQRQVRGLQDFITENFYACTKDTLFGLGQMYVADERFRRNIDSAGGEGTAEFVSRAIAVYCGK